MRHIAKQRGDTLVEVMLAIAVSAVVVMLTISVISRGLTSLQLSVERSQVRSHIEGQTAMLRYARELYMKDRAAVGGLAAQWRDNILQPVSQPNGYLNLSGHGVPGDLVDDTVCKPKSSKAFYIAYDPATGASLQPYAGATPQTIATPGRWMWIEAYNVKGSSPPDAIDFAVHACWNGPGGGVLQHEVTIMRLYDGDN